MHSGIFCQVNHRNLSLEFDRFLLLSVLLCTLVTGLCFWVSELIYDIQDRSRSKIGKKVEVQFDVAYYLIVISSALSLLASAFALLRRYPTAEEEHLER